MVEKILQAGTEQVNDQYVVETLLSKIVDIGNAGYDGFSACSKVQTVVDDGSQVTVPCVGRRGDGTTSGTEQGCGGWKGVYSRHPTRIL